MTKWQENYLKALCTSPEAFLAFKIKQKNQKVLKQYTNRLFPRYVNVINVEYLRKLLYNLLYRVNYEYYKGIYLIDIPRECLSLFSQVCDYSKIFHTSANCLDYKNELFSISSYSKKYNMFVDLIYNNSYVISRLEGENIQLFYRKKNFHVIYNSIFTLLRLLPKKNIVTVKNMNIGIEIEHLSNNSTNPEVQEEILRNGIVSYDSSFDGYAENRLRENRIRLDGIKGLPGLYILLKDMRKNCFMTENSSVHMHIDARYDNSFYLVNDSRFNEYTLRFDEIINECSPYLFKIFKIEKKKCNFFDYLQNINCRIRYNLNFFTVEYRICIPELVYTNYVIQILTLIHLTKCVKNMCKLNKNFLLLLLKIQCRK